jgi:hypothetical protein
MREKREEDVGRTPLEKGSQKRRTVRTQLNFSRDNGKKLVKSEQYFGAFAGAAID